MGNGLGVRTKKRNMKMKFKKGKQLFFRARERDTLTELVSRNREWRRLEGWRGNESKWRANKHIGYYHKALVTVVVSLFAQHNTHTHNNNNNIFRQT